MDEGTRPPEQLVVGRFDVADQPVELTPLQSPHELAEWFLEVVDDGVAASVARSRLHPLPVVRLDCSHVHPFGGRISALTPQIGRAAAPLEPSSSLRRPSVRLRLHAAVPGR